MAASKRFQVKTIALTGGPCAGKTSICELIKREFSKKLFCVPESASLLYGGNFPRAQNPKEMRFVQSAIYHVQVASEGIAHLQAANKRSILCDRGTLDCVAYWPASSAHFLKSVKSTLKQELARYDVVIHLETAAEGQGYGFSNPLRTESAKEALELDRKVQSAWKQHSNLYVIRQRSSFMDKVDEVLQVLRNELPGGL